MAQVPGIANFALAYRTPLQLDILQQAILQALDGRTFHTFRVQTKRGFKAFPLTSPDINRHVGHYLQEHLGAAVDLDTAELTVSIEILPHEAFFFFDRETGPGGLPVGVSGAVACLLSGGIDSPVAAYRMLKRGCTVVFLHFHSYPILNRVSQEKVRDLVTLLTRYQFASRLILIPFAPIQQQIVAEVDSSLSGGALSPLYGAHCRGVSATCGRQSPGDRGKRRSSGVANVGESGGHQCSSESPHVSTPHRHG